jgi:hypothetical protein
MAALIETEKMVNDYWVKKYGTIDKNSEDYNVLRSWASSKAFNARKPVTLEMLLKEVGQSKPMSTPSASASKPNPKPKPAASSMVKESLAYMYPLFGKKDGRGNVKKDDDELYKSMQAWIAEQVKVGGMEIGI